MTDGIVTRGSRPPVTVFASGGFGGGNIDTARWWGGAVKGTRGFFEYDKVAPWLPGRTRR